MRKKTLFLASGSRCGLPVKPPILSGVGVKHATTPHGLKSECSLPVRFVELSEKLSKRTLPKPKEDAKAAQMLNVTPIIVLGLNELESAL
jgi:hypothetical protein